MQAGNSMCYPCLWFLVSMPKIVLKCTYRESKMCSVPQMLKRRQYASHCAHSTLIRFTFHELASKAYMSICLRSCLCSLRLVVCLGRTQLSMWGTCRPVGAFEPRLDSPGGYSFGVWRAKHTMHAPAFMHVSSSFLVLVKCGRFKMGDFSRIVLNM